MSSKVTFFALALLAAASAEARNVTWTGGGSTTAWSDTGNWSLTPLADDTLVIPTEVTATTADITWANGYAGLQISGTSARVTVFPVAADVTMTVPLSGDGTMSATNATITGKYLALKNDNRAFTGPFYFDRAGVSMCHPYCFGYTNTVTAAHGSNSAYLQARNGKGCGNTYSNHFVLVDTSLYFNPSGGLHLTGQVDMEGFINHISDEAWVYASHWDGLVTNLTPTVYTTFRCGYLLEIGETGVVDFSNGRLQAFSHAMRVRGRIDSCSDFDVESSAVSFYRTNAIAPAVTLRFGSAGNYPRQAKFDMNGFDQQCGKFVIRNSDMSGNAHAYTDVPTNASGQAKAYVTSPFGSPATLTVRGVFECDPVTQYPTAYPPEKTLRMIYPLTGSASLALDTDPSVETPAEMHLSSALSDTNGGLYARRGKILVESTARLPNLTALEATNEGQLEIAAGAEVGTASELVVKVTDSGTMNLNENVNLAAKTAFVGKRWLLPGTYGSAEAIAAAGKGTVLKSFTGLGLMTIASYGGEPGFFITVR